MKYLPNQDMVQGPNNNLFQDLCLSHCYIITMSVCSTGNRLFLAWITLSSITINKSEHTPSPRTSSFWLNDPCIFLLIVHIYLILPD